MAGAFGQFASGRSTSKPSVRSNSANRSDTAPASQVGLGISTRRNAVSNNLAGLIAARTRSDCEVSVVPIGLAINGSASIFYQPFIYNPPSGEMREALGHKS